MRKGRTRIAKRIGRSLIGKPRCKRKQLCQQGIFSAVLCPESPAAQSHIHLSHSVSQKCHLHFVLHVSCLFSLLRVRQVFNGYLHLRWSPSAAFKRSYQGKWFLRHHWLSHPKAGVKNRSDESHSTHTYFSHLQRDYKFQMPAVHNCWNLAGHVPLM